MKTVLCISLFALFNFVLNGQTKYGTTIITHGYQPNGSPPIGNGDWALVMAMEILQKALNGQILKYNKSSGKFESIKASGVGGEKILLFDWAKESNNNSEGFSEAAGDALFAALILGYKEGDFTLSSLHFIGHSRGTVVNTLAVERLLVLKGVNSNKYQINIDQVTNIDPHDWGLAGIASDLNDAHKDILIDIPPNNTPNNGVIAWHGVFSDTYYQTNLPMIGEYNLTGRPVVGTMNFLWNKNDEGLPLRHGGNDLGIHNKGYTRTIKNNIKIKTDDGTEGGYHLSRIGGETKLRPLLISGTSLPTFSFEQSGILNGNFNRGNGIYFPGWEEHNGEVSPSSNATINNGVMELKAEQLINVKICHNRFYVPTNANSIVFDKKFLPIANSSCELTIEINGASVMSKKLEKADNAFNKECFDISSFHDNVITISFILIGEGQLSLDNIRFSKDECKTNSTLFLFDLSGSMNENGANSNISKLQQAKNASKQTLNGLKSNNSGSTPEVAVLGFSGGCVPDPTVVISNFETNLSIVESRIDAMGAGGGTPLAEAIAASECKLANHLAQTGQDKGKLIVLSDGQATCQQIRPPGTYNSGQLGQKVITVNASQCGGSNYKIKYYTIGFNVAAGSPAERDLQYLSQISGGKYLNAQSQTQLERAFKKFNRTYIPKPTPALSNLPSASATKFDDAVNQINTETFTPALKTCEEFTKLHPDDCNGAYNLALMQEANDFYKNAISNYQKYLSLCPNALDREFVEKQIAFLEEEFRQFLLFQKEVVKSDLEYLKLHFEKIQNGQSVALAEEFKGFLKEKGDYYKNLPELMGKSSDRLFKKNCQEVASGLDNCAKTINRNPSTWDRDATPSLSMIYLNLERLLESF